MWQLFRWHQSCKKSTLILPCMLSNACPQDLALLLMNFSWPFLIWQTYEKAPDQDIEHHHDRESRSHYCTLGRRRQSALQASARTLWLLSTKFLVGKACVAASLPGSCTQCCCINALQAYARVNSRIMKTCNSVCISRQSYRAC